MGAIRAAMALLRHVDFCAQWNRVLVLRHYQRSVLAEAVSDFTARSFCNRGRSAAVSSAPRRSHALQRGAEVALSRRHASRRADRDIGARFVEAGAIFRAREFVRQFSKYPAGTFFLHDGDCCLRRHSLAMLVPRSPVAMFTGGPTLDGASAEADSLIPDMRP